MLALSARDSHLGCIVPYRLSYNFDGREGWFRNLCRGESRDLANYLVFGPQPRDLDRFHVEIVDSRVIVDLSRLEPGTTAIPSGYELQMGGATSRATLARSLPQRWLQRKSEATQQRKLARARAARPTPRWQTLNATTVA